MQKTIITTILILTILVSGCSSNTKNNTTTEPEIPTTFTWDIFIDEECYTIIQKDINYFLTINPLYDKIYCDMEKCCTLTTSPDNDCLVANCIPKKEINK